MKPINSNDRRLIPRVGGKFLTGVTGYRFLHHTGRAPTITIELTSDWVPPLEDATVAFDLSAWSQEARNMLRRDLDAADLAAKKK